MITGLSALAAVIAILNLWMAWRTFQSQKASTSLSQDTKRILAETKVLQDRFFSDMNDALQQIKTFQEVIDSRERLIRQERARIAVTAILKALRRQVYAMDGRWVPSPSGLTLKDDPLEPVRAYEFELAWVPPCTWKTKCQELFQSIGPVAPGVGQQERLNQHSLLVNGCSDLEPAGSLRLYEECMVAIDEMT